MFNRDWSSDVCSSDLSLSDKKRSLGASILFELAPKHKGGEFEEYRSAEAALLVAEREWAASKNEEHAVEPRRREGAHPVSAVKNGRN